MPKDLEQDLGLPAVIAISMGAMIGSGIFILPGLALKMAGPAVILAYVVAALLVLPAALSKSEMATAMPESGGTYLYIERGMGPLLGTIAGVGTWFSLTFKGALALVGGAPYLVLLLDLPVTPVAIGAALILIVVNLVGVKQTGRLQIAIVAVMLAALAWFIGGGAPDVSTAHYAGFFDEGIGGLLAATGFVFVSYTGVTKIASVAEEIENPDRNIPLGMLGSLAATTLLYAGLVAVMVGVVPADKLAGSNIPMALAAEQTLASGGVLAIVVAAVLALISTANAGILSSSRYPLAMSRDSLAPPSLHKVSDRFGTPMQAIGLTGGVLLVMVAFVPITQIAKLASAFKILVFVLINVAVVALREADNADYDPSFETPFYPFPQVVGVVGGIVLLPFMGVVPIVGAVLIVAGSLVWYYTYVRRRGDVNREGAAADAVRQHIGEQVVAETESAVDDADPYDLLIAVTERTSPEREQTLLRVGAAIARARGGTVRIVRFDEVPDQVPLDTAADHATAGDRSFEDRSEQYCDEFNVPITYGEVVSHDTKHAIVNQAERLDVNAVVLERRADQLHMPVFESDIDWIKRNAPCDIIEIEDRGIDTVDEIAVVSDRGPYDPTKIMIADALAAEADASVELLLALEADAPPQQRETSETYLEDLEPKFDVPVTSRLVETDDRAAGLIDVLDDTDLFVISVAQGELRGAILGRSSDRIIEGTECTAVAVDATETGSGRLRRFLENRVF